MTNRWITFANTADEWIVNYSLPVSDIPSVKLFSIGHALELYLKAAIAKDTNNVDMAIGFGHNIPKMWQRCKGQDANFLPGYELREKVLARNLLEHSDYCRLNQDDRKHFLLNQELYIAAKYLADLKYLGAPLKQIKAAYSLGFTFPNPKWAQLFRELREYLGYPASGTWDILQHHIDSPNLCPSSVRFLEEILNEKTQP